MEEARYVIRKVGKADITDCVSVIRRSFRTVAEEFGFTEENAPGFTAFSTTEEKVLYWMTEQHRSMYGCFKEEQLVGYYNLLPTENGYELGSLSVLPEYRHAGIGRILLTDAMIRVAAEGAGRMEISIVEENTILRKWYESMGFLHTGTKKFDFFPFTAGYMERDLKAGPLRLEKLMISRGHIILWLEQAASAPRFVYISGELTMNGRFYTDLFREWYWVEKPEGSVYFLDNLTVLGTVTDEEKLQIIIAANERNKADQENVQIVHEPVSSPRTVHVAKTISPGKDSDDYPQYDCKRESGYFYGVSREFSTKNEEQYQTIGAFWDEMSAKYGLEKLQGLGYSWTEDTITYAIGLKDDMLDDYDVEIWLPENGWKAVKGRTEDLGRIYDSIYRDGSLTYEIETFSSDGNCEICFYRMGDAWMEGGFEVKGLLFDTAKCSAYYRPKEPDKIVLASNFTYTGDSSIKWWDEASYGMCTHPCTKEETVDLYHILQDIPSDKWHFTGAFRNLRVSEEIRQKALEILRDYTIT